MKRLKLIKHTIRLFFMASLFIFSNLNAQSPVESWGQLRIEGPDIVNEDGEKIQLQGMSLFWSQWQPSFYEYNTIKWLRDDWCANIIRPACGVEDNGNPYNGLDYQLNMARKVIDAAIELNIYVLVDWHAHYAIKNKEAAKTFFRTIAQEYGEKPNIIYETFNEPLGYDWNTLKGYHQEIITEIRKYDPDNIIVCGTPSYSAYPDAPIGNAINQANIAYTLHYYAASHFQDYRNRANAARNNGLCVFVTEYGLVNADGGGNVNEGSSKDWWNWMNSNKISHCNWSLGNKDEGASALKPGTPASGFWTQDQLTWSGSMVKENLKANCPSYSIKVPTTTTIPGKVEAETYSKMFGIQREPTTDIGGGQNVGYTEAGDYFELSINATGSGTYELNYRVAAKTTSSFKVFIDGVEKHSITVNTGDWQNWETQNKTLDISAGPHTIKLLAITGGWNINYIDFKAQNLKDCNGDVNGVAKIDDCKICSGGNTGIAINACQGGCLSGYSAKGVKDDFSLEKEPFNIDGGVYAWGEEKLIGDKNPEFQALINRNFSAKKLNIVLTQGQGKYAPFGFSFGGETNPNTININENSTFEFTFKNPTTSALKIAITIQDANGNIINTGATAKGQIFSDAWKHEINAIINAGATYTFKGDFKNGYFANYATKSYDQKLDLTKVTSILLTVTNTKNTGSPSFEPLALNNISLEITDLRLGDCAQASNDNNKDCNGVLNGSASIDDCKVCSGGTTGKVINECNINGLNEKTENSLNIYPNPAKNELLLSLQTPWILIDALGSILYSGESQLIDITVLQSGIYFIKTDSETQKFIKE